MRKKQITDDDKIGYIFASEMLDDVICQGESNWELDHLNITLREWVNEFYNQIHRFFDDEPDDPSWFVDLDYSKEIYINYLKHTYNNVELFSNFRIGDNVFPMLNELDENDNMIKYVKKYMRIKKLQKILK